ncbi:MAG: DUF4389 domain-containing protein [Pseudomonadota bacterium]|nr:DUF4389 domain-containing protein [Pseudomonadota bacterium]
MNVINMHAMSTRYRHLFTLDLWLRFFCVASCVFILYMIKSMIWVFMGLQIICLLFTGKISSWLLSWAQMFCVYFYQLLEYVLFVTDTRPYPFYGPWFDGLLRYFRLAK